MKKTLLLFPLLLAISSVYGMLNRPTRLSPYNRIFSSLETELTLPLDILINNGNGYESIKIGELSINIEGDQSHDYKIKSTHFNKHIFSLQTLALLAVLRTCPKKLLLLPLEIQERVKHLNAGLACIKKQGCLDDHTAPAIVKDPTLIELIFALTPADKLKGRLENLLSYAAYQGSISGLQFFFDRKVSAHITIDGSSLLHCSAQTGQVATLQFLLEQGAHINSTNELGSTPLHRAATHKRYQAVVFLVENGAHINQQDSLGLTPLISAIMAHDQKIVACLLNHAADYTLQDSSGDDALYWAENEHFPTIESSVEVLKMVQKLYAQQSKQNTQTIQPLSEEFLSAAHTGNIEALTRLIKAGCSVDCTDVKGNTGLILACQVGRQDVVLLFITHGSDPKLRNKAGDSALDIAQRYGHGTIAQLLREAEANRQARNTIGSQEVELGGWDYLLYPRYGGLDPYYI